MTIEFGLGVAWNPNASTVLLPAVGRLTALFSSLPAAAIEPHAGMLVGLPGVDPEGGAQLSTQAQPCLDGLSKMRPEALVPHLQELEEVMIYV